MPYASLQDLNERFGTDEVTVAADRDGDGSADTAAVDRALEDATAEVDAYLAVRYALPLAEVPPIIVRLTADIAFHRLSPEAPASSEQRRTRYDEAVSLLKRIASGDVALGLEEAPARSGGAPYVESNERRWRRNGRRVV